MNTLLRPLLLLLLGIAAGCGSKEVAAPPAKSVNVTVATVIKKDLAITESAVGAESAIDLAQLYDPTRAAGDTLYVRLPFPEHVARDLKIGQSVTLRSFGDEKRSVAGRIKEIRPALNSTTLSREVLVAVSNAAGWRPGGSVTGEVALGRHVNALIVPEQAVVLRPAGAGAAALTAASVVYVVEGDAIEQRTVRQRAVKTGILRNGELEIVEGVQEGETVVVDGASLMSEGTRIKVRDPAAPAEAAKP